MKKLLELLLKRDYLQYLKNIEDARVALEKCRSIVMKNNLNMNIIDATYNFDKSQLLFRFLSDERVVLEIWQRNWEQNLELELNLDK